MTRTVLALIAAFSIAVMSSSPSMAGPNKSNGGSVHGSAEPNDFSGKASGSGR